MQTVEAAAQQAARRRTQGQGKTERPSACGGAVSKVARARPHCVGPSVGGQEGAAAVDSDSCAVALL